VRLLAAESGCKALEVERKALELSKDEVMVINIDMNFDLTDQLNLGYLKKNDLEGSTCVLHIKDRLNISLDSFFTQVQNLKDERDMLTTFLDDKQFSGKRSTGVAVAVVLGMVNLIATSSSYIYSDYRLNNLKGRITELEGVVEGLYASHGTMFNNAEFLYNENTFHGIHKNLIVEHVNQLKDIHSCDILNLSLERIISGLESTLNKFLDAIISGKLNRFILNHESLKKLTLEPIFKETIFFVAPSELYSLAKVNLFAFSKTKITFLMSFPKISRLYNFQMVNVVDLNKNLLLPKTDHSFRFLVPLNVSLNQVSMPSISSANHCLYTKHFVACQRNSIVNSDTKFCVKSLLDQKVDDRCFKKVEKKHKFLVDYTSTGAVLEVQKGSQIFSTRLKKIRFSFDYDMCIFLPKENDLVLRISNQDYELFPKVPYFSMNFLGMATSLNVEKGNMTFLSLPQFNNSNKFNETKAMTGNTLFLLFHKNKTTILIVSIMLFLSIVTVSICIVCIIHKCKKGKDDDGKVNIHMHQYADGRSL